MTTHLRSPNFGRLFSLLVATVLAGLLLAYGVTEEVPVGGLQGTASMGTSGKPIAKAGIFLTPRTDDPELRSRSRYAATDENGRFVFRGVPAGTYILSAYGKAHVIEGRLITVEEGAPGEMKLELAPLPPRLDLYAAQRVVTPGEKPRVEVHGFLPDTKDLTLTVYRVDLDALRRLGTLERVLRYFDRYQYGEPLDKNEVATKAQTIAHRIENLDGEGTFIDRLSLEPLPEGMYVVTVDGGQGKDAMSRSVHLNVTRLAMVAKSGPGGTVCYVTDMETGRPVAGATVENFAGGTQTTSPEGLARFPRNAASGNSVLLARNGASMAVVAYHGRREQDGQTRIFLYTDRPVYRPGDEIQFKGIVRSLSGVEYRVPAEGRTVSVQMWDPSEEEMQSLEVPVNGSGTFNGSFKLNAEGLPGPHRLEASLPNAEASLYVPVAAYRKPEYTVQVTTPEPYYAMGDTVTAEVKCEYYFGGPVPNAKVTLSVYRARLYDGSFWEDEEEESEEYAYGGEMVHEAEAVTGADGVARVRFPTSPPAKSDGWPTDYQYQIQAFVTDEGGRYFEGQGRVKVVRGDVRLAIETDRYVLSPKEEAVVTLVATDHATGRPVANQPIRLEIGNEHWSRQSGAVYQALEVRSLQTDAEGRVRTTVASPTEAPVVLKASTRDRRNRTVESRESIYVTGSPWWGQDMAPIEITLDRRNYSLGDQARVLITTKNPGGSALLTVEANDVLLTRVVSLERETTEVELPVRPEYVPNVFVSVAYVRGKEYAENSKRLRVDLKERKLDVRLTPSKEVLLPGETVRYDVRTLDDRGRPVPAELSLAVVDESIFAIREDGTDILEGFYPMRWNSVSTYNSFPELYLDGGEKATPDISVRRDFRDTAGWFPVVQTDASGNGQVELRLPDNLTSWRATAIGVTADTDVGMAKASVRVRKPLAVRLQAPAYLVVNDDVNVVAVINNDTGQDAEVHVDLASENMAVAGQARQRVRVRAGQPVSVRWNLRPAESGEAKLVVKAWTDAGDNDGMEARFDVRPHGHFQQDVTSGDVRGEETVTVRVDSSADRNSGKLKVTLSPTVAASMANSLKYLIGFPYGCTEQTMNRFMPAVILSRTFGQTGLPMPVAKDELDRIVAEGLLRLRRMRHSDGGWGWWEQGEPDIFMTALVLDGLHRAKQAGYEVLPLGRTFEWAEKALAEPIPVDPLDFHAKGKVRPTRDRLYLCYALALHGETERARKALGTLTPPDDPAGLALAVLAHAQTGNVAGRDRYLARLMEGANETQAMMTWSSEAAWGAEPTALALQALLAARPNDPRAPKIVRGLMAMRRGDHWSSTRDTAYTLLSLSEYLAATGELREPADLAIVLNGRTLAQRRVEPGLDMLKDLEVEIPLRELAEGEHKVQVARNGGGVAYYTVDLGQWVQHGELASARPAPGLTVTRRYYTLSSRRGEDGVLRLLPSPRPVEQVRAGELVRCEIVIQSDRPREYIMVEDFFPSNLRVAEREGLGEGEYWYWWWNRTAIRDDRIAFFSTFLKQGENKIEYTLRAEVPGTSRALPTRVMNMYDPAQQASSAGSRLEVRP
jgi:alpha-2-macroglobulin